MSSQSWTSPSTYFRDEEERDPTITEVRVVDTYWSDHCRHTTFSTHLDEVNIDDPVVKAAYEQRLGLVQGGLPAFHRVDEVLFDFLLVLLG